jgi:hypothetical protein
VLNKGKEWWGRQKRRRQAPKYSYMGRTDSSIVQQSRMAYYMFYKELEENILKMPKA